MGCEEDVPVIHLVRMEGKERVPTIHAAWMKAGIRSRSSQEGKVRNMYLRLILTNAMWETCT